MAQAALKLAASVDGRRRDALRLLELEIEYEPVAAEIADIKERLKAAAERSGGGFIEHFNEGRYVKVSSGSESKLKGLMPELDAAACMALPAGKLKKLIDDGIIAMVKQFTKASRPSVTVKL